MTSTTSVGWSITQISLSNILENCLTQLVDEIATWRINRSQALKYRELHRQVGRGSYDKSAFDYYDEYVARNDGRAVAFELLLDLYVGVGSNPFPEQKLRLLEVAAMLFPEISIGFTPKVAFRGRAAWRSIFAEFELPASFEIAFPARVEDVDIVEVERKLLELAGERVTLPVKETKDIIHWEPRSKTYKAVKDALEGRGWVWKCAKQGGTVRKVIALPKR
jgi:hypothetical protein